MRDLTGDPNIKVTFHEKPMPFSLRFQTYITAASNIFSSFLFAIAYLMVSDTLCQTLIHERKTNLKHQLIVSGASPLSYWTANYLIDVLT